MACRKHEGETGEGEVMTRCPHCGEQMQAFYGSDTREDCCTLKWKWIPGSCPPLTEGHKEQVGCGSVIKRKDGVAVLCSLTSICFRSKIPNGFLIAGGKE